MISVDRVIKPGLQRSYVARNGGSGKFCDFIKSQGASGKGRAEVEGSWLVAKGATASKKGSNELWDSYLTSKGFTTGPLKDRMKAFFISGTQA